MKRSAGFLTGTTPLILAFTLIFPNSTQSLWLQKSEGRKIAAAPDLVKRLAPRKEFTIAELSVMATQADNLFSLGDVLKKAMSSKMSFSQIAGLISQTKDKFHSNSKDNSRLESPFMEDHGNSSQRLNAEERNVAEALFAGIVGSYNLTTLREHSSFFEAKKARAAQLVYEDLFEYIVNDWQSEAPVDKENNETKKPSVHQERKQVIAEVISELLPEELQIKIFAALKSEKGTQLISEIKKLEKEDYLKIGFFESRVDPGSLLLGGMPSAIGALALTSGQPYGLIPLVPGLIVSLMGLSSKDGNQMKPLLDRETSRREGIAIGILEKKSRLENLERRLVFETLFLDRVYAQNRCALAVGK